MEKIMSNERELTNDELDTVSGGAEFVITKLMDVSVSGGDGGGGPTPSSAWNTLLYQYGYIK
jgi:bacteriocin-like protein